MVEQLQTGSFYFVSDSYYARFHDKYMLPNKGDQHGRPCYYAFVDTKTGLYWMVPISSKVEKYHRIANQKVEKYGFCNTILFGQVLGQERAFLIQNMFPVTSEFISEQYIDRNSGAPVRASNSFIALVNKNAKTVLSRHRHGAKLIFSDVLSIERQLLES